MKITDVLIKPMITEKSTQLSKGQVYLFQVGMAANKHQIAQTIEELYKVKVDSVRMSVRKGKEKKVGRRFIKKQLPDTKIAYVRLAEGTIDLFPQA